MKKNFIIFVFIFIVTLGYSQSIELVKDINSNGNSFPQKFGVATFKASLNNTVTRLFFMANDGQSNGVFLTDGTDAGTKNILSNITNVSYFTTFNTSNYLVQSPTVLFVCENTAYGSEIWKTNGLSNNTQILKDIYIGTSSSNPSNIVVFNNIAYFAATSSSNLRSIYSTTGNASETQIAVPFNLGANSMIFFIDTLNNHLIFAAYTLQNGAELWISDGTDAGTQLVKEIASGNANAFDTLYGGIRFSPVHFNGKIYFSAKSSSYNNEPWFSDGTSAGTLCLKEINPNGSSNPTNFVVCNDKLYFIAWDGTEYGIYESNGSVNSADKIISLGTSSNLPYLYTFNNSIYYMNNNTGMIKQYNTQNQTLLDFKQAVGCQYCIFSAKEYNGRLYMRIPTSSTTAELWCTDGTITNTIQLQPTNAISPGNPSGFTVYDGSLYFTANFTAEGIELWKLTDSTSLLPPTFNLISDKKIYPNPANDFLNIEAINSDYFYIYNVLGELMLVIQNTYQPIEISKLPEGIYIIRDEKLNTIGKFIKK